MGRYARIALILTILLCAAWTAIWIGVRAVIGSHADQILAGDPGTSAKLVCQDRRLGGFPFRMAFSCSSAGLTVRETELSAMLGGLDIVALAYRPQHVIADLTGPLDVVWNGAPSPLKGNWTTGRTSIRFAQQALARLSAEFDNLTIATNFQSAAMAHSEFHVQPTAQMQQTDIAFSADATTISIAAETSDPFSLVTTLRVDIPAVDLLAGGLENRDIAIPDLQIRMSAAGSRIVISGALNVGSSGLINGDVTIVTENLQALAGFLQTLPSSIRYQTQALVGSIVALARPAKNDRGEPVSELALSIRDNGIYAGSRRIGEFAPAF